MIYIYFIQSLVETMPISGQFVPWNLATFPINYATKIRLQGRSRTPQPPIQGEKLCESNEQYKICYVNDCY